MVNKFKVQADYVFQLPTDARPMCVEVKTGGVIGGIYVGLCEHIVVGDGG